MRSRALLPAVFAATAAWAYPSRAGSQGCEPIRFTAPVSLGGEKDAYLSAREWQLTLAYRGLVSKDWFVGTRENPALAPGGTSPVFRIHTVVADLAYSISDRYRVSVSVPFSTASLARVWPDQEFHVQRARGIGDVSVLLEGWALEPLYNEDGNLAFGIGVKAPTGSHSIGSTFYGANAPVEFPADQTIQPGDGGWALLLQTRAFRQFTSRAHGYAFASYMVSPKARSDVRTAPVSGPFWSVPDVYSARAGAAFAVWPDAGLSASLGARMDGIPVRDVLGGGDDSTTKRTSYMVFADPGLAVSSGRNMLSLSVPYRVKVNRTKSLLEQRTGALNAGGFAKTLIFLSYSRRL
ncbi:MAG: hypothetical protein ACSLFE_06890 [Gemmatimonadaceae bacterium]